MIGKLLRLASYVGPISSRKGSSLIYGMTVENGFAYTEVTQLFDRKGWGYVSREEFDDALKTDGILSYNARTPEGAQQKLERDRRQARIKRSS